MRRKILIAWSICMLFAGTLMAQKNEVGILVGASNYIGDLNTNTNFELVGPGATLFWRNNPNTRISFKHSISYGVIEGRDELSPNEFQQQRNLSFKSSIFELATMFEFNFFTYDKYKEDKNFTPYLTTGVAVFLYNPKAEYQGEWYELQPLGTEGQSFPDYTGKDPYKLVSWAIPVGMGVKYSVNRHWNIGFEATVRKTFTDYLDDVSTTYPSPLDLPGGPNSIAHILSDRSIELGEPVGQPGYQRGTSPANDDYFIFGFTLSYTFLNEHCPTPKGFK